MLLISFKDKLHSHWLPMKLITAYTSIYSTLYSRSPTYKWVPFQDHIPKCNKVSLGTQIIQSAIYCCFYTCFQTSWAWNKDLLYTALYSNVHKSTTPCRGCTHMTVDARHVNWTCRRCSHLWKFATWRFVCRQLTAQVFCLIGLPCGSAGKESTCKTGDLGSIAGLGRPPGEFYWTV